MLVCVLVRLNKKEGREDHLEGVKLSRSRNTPPFGTILRYQVFNMVLFLVDRVLGHFLVLFVPNVVFHEQSMFLTH